MIRSPAAILALLSLAHATAANAGPLARGPRSAGALLLAADEALDRGELDDARDLYERLVVLHPRSIQADAARDAIRAINTILGPRPAPETPPRPEEKPKPKPRPPPPPTVPPEMLAGTAPPSPPLPAVVAEPPAEPIELRQTARPPEPVKYSNRTRERLELAWWERADFVVTAGYYGAMTGGLFTAALGGDDSMATASVFGGLGVYGAASLLHLMASDPDRGDLPAAMAIVSYVPMTVLFLGLIVGAGGEKVMGAMAASSVISLPVAWAVANRTNLDPGDTQLVRDAGFWSMVLAIFGTLGLWPDRCDGPHCYSQGPSNRAIGLAGLLGLYGGMATGIAAARATEVSLERVRVATLAGYAGLVGGGAIGARGDSDSSAFLGMALGGAAALGIGFALGYKLDEIPSNVVWVDDAVAVSPAMMQARDRDGVAVPAFGFQAALP